MGHCISVYLLKKEELRNQKIDSVLEKSNKSNDIKFVELKNGILATTWIPNIKEFGSDKMIAKISTDYFGGIGNQTAQLFDSGKRIYKNDDDIDRSSSPINDVLKLMGIKRAIGMDEFDTIGLGNYRSNHDFEK